MSQDPASQSALLLLLLRVVLGIDVLLIGVVAWRRSRGNATFAPRWSVVDVWFVLQCVVFAVVCLLVPLTFAAVWAGVSLQELETMSSKKVMIDLLLPSAILQNIPFFLIPAAWIGLKYRLPLRAIGLRPRPRGRDWIAGIGLGLLAMALSAGASAIVESVAAHFSFVGWVQAAIALDKTNAVANMEDILPHIGTLGIVMAIVGVGIAAPFGEEMLFRGFAFNAIKRRFGLVAGILLSALLFTLPHGYGLGLVPVFVIGALLAWAYNNSGSLWVTIIMHATNNTIQVLLATFLPVSHH